MENNILHSSYHGDKIGKGEAGLFGISFFMLALIALCLTVALNSSGMCCVAAGILLIAMNRNVDASIKAIAVFLLVFLNYLLYLHLTSFDFLPQAHYLLSMNDNLLVWFQSGHIHAIRLLIAYPGYLLQLLFDVELNQGFGGYCTIIFTLLFLFLERIKQLFGAKLSASYYDFLLFGFVVFLFFVMNGRIAFAFLGYAILINEMILFYKGRQRRQWFSRYVKIIAGIILGTVSSGTMMVCICFTVTMFVITVVRDRSIGKGAIRLISIAIAGFPVIIYALQYVAKMIDKNVSYFGGGFLGIINMLQHGIGAVFGIPSTLMIIWMLSMGAIFLIGNLALLRYVYRKSQDIFPLILSANIAFYGAFVGFSTGTLILIPLCIILLLGLRKIADKGYGHERKKHI